MHPAAGALSVVAGAVATAEAEAEGVGVADGVEVTIGVTVVSEFEIMIWPTATADKRTTEAITSDFGLIDLRSVGIRVTLFSTNIS